MELFPAQPDLSLQISLPNNNKSTASGGGGGWISSSRTIATNREDKDHNMQDHGNYGTSSFYNSTSSPIFTPPITKPSFTDTSATTTTTTCGNNLNLSMSNSIRPIPQEKQPILFSNHHYFQQNNNTSTCNGATLHFSNSSSFYHKVAPHQQGGGVDMANNTMTSGGGGGCSSNEIMGFLRPIRGIPVYQHQNHNSSTSTNATPPTAACLNFPFAVAPTQQPCLDSLLVASSSSSSINSMNPNNNIHITGFASSSSSQLGLLRSSSSRFLSRFPAKRSMRAPRMRWTTTLHARFVHAVDLLGGHDRATPKSVLELMDVKDLTLAHVKSHLQMYRTVKTTDRAAASSGQSDLFENGSSGDTSEDQIFDNIQNPRRSQESEKEYQGLWTNSSSREAWLHGKQRNYEEINIPSLQLREEKKAKGFSKAGKKEMDGQCISSYERISEVSSSSQLSLSDTSLLFCSKKNPNLDLEFTLGRSLC